MECLMRLTEELIASLQRSGQSRHLYDSVVEGLCLSISGSGAKTWYLCSEFLGEDERIKLGVHPKLSVKAARLKANRIDALAENFEQKNLPEHQCSLAKRCSPCKKTRPLQPAHRTSAGVSAPRTIAFLSIRAATRASRASASLEHI